MIQRIFSFYTQALHSSVASTTGRRLWFILALKIFILLILFKILFFPDRLQTDYTTDADRAAAVRSSLTSNINHHP